MEFLIDCEFGENATFYDREKIIKKALACSKFYNDDCFNIDEAYKSDLPVIIFRGGCGTLFPASVLANAQEHRADVLKYFGVETSSCMRKYIDTQVRKDWHHGKATPENQISRSLEGLYGVDTRSYQEQSKNRKSYVRPIEWFVQRGNRESPIHLDYGRNVAFVPPSFSHALKIWVLFPKFKSRDHFALKTDNHQLMRMVDHPDSIVLVQRAGDIVYLRPLVYHSVLLVYKKSTPVEDQWCIGGGNTFIREDDLYQSFLYVTKGVHGRRQDSPEAWAIILTAFFHLSGRKKYKYERELDLFQKALRKGGVYRADMAERSKRASNGLGAKSAKKRRMNEVRAILEDNRKKKSLTKRRDKSRTSVSIDAPK